MLVGSCLESIVDKKIDLKKVAFSQSVAKQPLEYLITKWKEITNIILGTVSQVCIEDISSFIDNKDKTELLIRNLGTQLNLFRTAMNPPIFSEFSSMIWNG